MVFRAVLKFFVVFLLAGVPLLVCAQQPTATVRGLVADPDDAVIPGATVTLTPAAGKALTTLSQGDGTYTVKSVPAGVYSMTVTMPGFASFVKQGIRVSAGQMLTLDAKLAIQTESEVVQVSTTTTQLSVDQDSNASSTTIKGKDLDALSDDPDELSSELSALAGPAAGPNGGQIYVDGFTGGQLPPKSSIREIRVNQNPFSAQYERLGYGRVEVFTKPGTDKFHGSYLMTGNDSAFNTTTPFVTSQPPYHTIFVMGNVTGPISSNASFALAGSHRAIQDNTIINGEIVANSATPTVPCDPGVQGCVTTPFQSAVPLPQTRTDLSPRIDLQLGEKNTLTARLQLYQNDTQNNGVGDFSLPSTAYSVSSSEYELQVSDTQVLSPRVINESRLELGRNRDTQAALSTAPTVNVQGAFVSGGASTGSSSARQARFELQNYTSIQLAKNFIRFGGRLRVDRESSNTSSNTNGSFTYTSAANYQAGKLSQFSITKINSGIVATFADVGLYLEDDWKARPNLTLSYGFRYETQAYLNDHHDFAPRVSFAYGLGSTKGTPKTVLRGGFGMFYDRYQNGLALNTIRQNGVNQQQLLLKNPSVTNPNCAPNQLAACGTPTAATTTTYTAAPNLRTPYTMQFAIGADQQLFKGATLSVNYLNARGVHQFVSQNVNFGQTVGGLPAPTQYQYQSEGVFRQNQLIANFNLRNSKYYSIFGYYVLNFAKSDTAGASSFPTTPFNLGADYGRASFDTRNRLFLGGSITLPYRVTLSPFIVAQSGTPYNVTLGTDQNGDSIFNDRPAFLPGQSSADCSSASSFLQPAPGVTGYTQIPINYCTGPSLFTTNLRVAKVFGFGPSTAKPQAGADSGGPGPGGLGGRGGPGGGGGGGRGGPGGPGGFGGGASSGKRYNLSFGAQFQNLFDRGNFSPPVGVLRSPTLFGQTTQLAGGIYTSSSAIRRISLQMSFNF